MGFCVEFEPILIELVVLARFWAPRTRGPADPPLSRFRSAGLLGFGELVVFPGEGYSLPPPLIPSITLLLWALT